MNAEESLRWLALRRPVTGYRRCALWCVVAGGALLGLAAAAQQAGLRINVSASLPLGLYRTQAAPLTKGAYVLLCPPETAPFILARERGYVGQGGCPGGAAPLMKKILAAKGDRVCIGAQGVSVNGMRLASSTPLPADAAGRALPRYRMPARVLGTTELLLMSPARAQAFDARYFGPLQAAQIERVIVPLWTWP